MPTYVSALKFTAGVPAKPGDPGYFLGLDVNVSPLDFFNDHTNHPYGWLAFLVPVLAMVLQFINTKIMQTPQQPGQTDQMGQSMKMMNYMMPIMSGFFCLSLNMGIGLYWIAGSLFRIVQGIFINKQVDKISMEELIEKNKDKAAKKQAKLKERNERMEQYSNMRTSNIKSVSGYKNKPSEGGNSSSDRSANAGNASETKGASTTVNKNYKQGSIAGYAHMSSGNKKDK